MESQYNQISTRIKVGEEKKDVGAFSKGRDREKEKELVLEIENERTLYENEYQGGFDRVVPLPIEVGGILGRRCNQSAIYMKNSNQQNLVYMKLLTQRRNA